MAILDTGVDKTHPFLEGSVVSEACYSTNDPENDSSSLCPGGVEDSTEWDRQCPMEETVLRESATTGLMWPVSWQAEAGSAAAPDQVWPPKPISLRSRYSLEVAGYGPGAWNSDLIKGLERVYELRHTYSIASVNMSLGGGQHYAYCDTSPLKGTIDNLRTAGIATVIASGNNGCCGSIGAPACISSAISVGATMILMR